ncbi:MAG: hypothetical protein E7314_04865 [Clostridiales bacterium]|nr:hypothetical protein [Clostridiales bacterium]
MLTKKFEYEIEELKNDIDFMLNNKNIMNEKNINNFLFSLEKHRFNLFEEVRIINTNKKDIEIKNINSEYKVDYHKTFKIYIPEVLPKYKNIGNYTYKNILLNVANVTKDYKNLYKNKQVCIYIEVFENKKKENWDIDNKTIKPSIDGLVASKVIEDDSIRKMFYCVKGYYDKNPHTEVTIFEAKKFMKWIRKHLGKQ